VRAVEDEMPDIASYDPGEEPNWTLCIAVVWVASRDMNEVREAWPERRKERWPLEWERFLADLYKRGLTGEGLDMICVDGGSGLLAALPMVYDKIPVQRCWAHKIRNVLNKVRKADEKSVKADLHAVMNADTAMKARSAARRFAERWGQAYPAAVACLRTISTSF